NGDVFAAGLEWSGVNLYDMLLIKYDNTGAQQWVNTLDYANGNDGLNKIGVSGRPYVGGGIQDMFGSYEYAVYTFNLSSGGLGFGSSSVGTTPGFNRLADLAVDDTGNVYITGFTFDPVTKYDIRTIKLDSNLNVVWSWDYDAGYNMDDEGTGLALDSHNNVIVVGYSQTAFNGKNYTVLKYNNAGSLLWIENYDDPAFGDDSASAVVIGKNDTDAIYVTGYSFNGSTNDYWTMKLDGQGNQVWGIAMNSVLNGDDKATAIALDSLGDVIVSGQNKLGDSVFAYTTVKYVQKNMLSPDDTISYTSNSFVFIENKDQLMGMDSILHPEVKYYTLKGSPNVYFKDTAVSYVFTKIDTSSANQDSVARVDIRFLGANADQCIRATDVRDEYCNFYLGHIPEGRCHVQNYNQLVSFNVWNNVDIVYGSNVKGLKTYYMCKPGGGGGSAGLIDLKYEGADSVRIDGSGQLLIYTKLGTIIQPKASVWQIDASGNFSALAWQPSYNLVATNEVKFTSFGSYNPALTLVIAVDWGNIWPISTPTGNLLWSTFEGGSSDDVFNSVTAGLSNWVFAGGYTYSLTFPQQIGTNQNGNAGQQDGIVQQFNGGFPLWSTYFGGSSGDAIQSVSGNGGTGEVYFTGGTQSLDFPIGGMGPYVPYSGTTANGPSDAIIARLNINGFRAWATCYGSSTGNEVGTIIKATNQYSNFYVAGNGADASTPLTTETGASNLTVGTSFILKYHYGNFTRLWATLYGGTSSAVTSTHINDLELTVGNSNYLIVTGTTIGVTDLPSPTNSYGGGSSDAFVASFNSADLLSWTTYYGGTSSDYGAGGDMNSFGEIFITGETKSSDLPVPNPNSGYNDNSYAGGILRGDAYVAQFDIAGTLIWGTYLGGT
ncbi:MAG TPA: hypothetical protein VK826_15345, partial [Bacteroidia bacterium]|nr:hypothetical protein [Bacteroidia bacterium]